MIQAIDKKIVVEPFKEEVTESGILLASDTTLNSKTGKIIAKSKNVHDLEVGHKIVYRSAMGKYKEFHLVHYDEILAVVD